jgi:hypothetical protein
LHRYAKTTIRIFSKIPSNLRGKITNIHSHF